jgi:hypothetical protein
MNRNFERLEIVRILLTQVAVLLALGGAVVWYVNWSSAVALKEFIGADQPALSNPHSQWPSQAPVQTVKSKSACARKA